MFKKILILIIIFLIYSFYKLPWNYTRYILLCFTIVYFTTKIIFKRWFSLPNLARNFLIKYEKEDNQSILIDLCKNKDEDNFDSDIIPSSFTCLACGECCDGRHGYENLINLQPFKGLLIDKTINKSLTELFETILELYIFRWTDEIKEFKKDDDKFKNEIRYLLKYLTSTLLKRLSNLDLNKIIYHKLIPLLIQHFQTFLTGKRQANSQQFVEKSVLKAYIRNGLICKNIRSKNEEIKWIRNLIELIMPYLLPPYYLYSTISKSFLREIFTCCLVFPLFELASDPLYVNDILMLIFNDNNEKLEKDKLENMDNNFVELLENYELNCNDDNQLNTKKEEDSFKSDLLGIEFHKLLQNQQMLIIFFQYLKDEGSINYLQFILSLESFNEKLFDPEISENEKIELHADALHIYRTYLLSNGCDYLGIIDNQLIIEMKDILDKDYEHILELRSLEPLLKAYDQIYSKLERFYYPQFLNSDYYIKMIVGSRLFNFLNECSTEQSIFNEEDCEELFENQDEYDCEEDDVEEDVYDYSAIDLIDIMNADSVSTNELLEENEKVHDLSAWKCTIDKVDTKIEHNTFKYYYVFQIKIETDDNELNNEQEDGTPSINQWIVNRKYDEFYVLDGKLRKFHGNALSRIVGLSSKRTLFKQSLAFLESKKLEFEKYLNELINIPALKRSELIYNFLKPKTDTTTQEEDIFNTKLVDINLKRMIRTVPAKMFSQERGKHCEEFLNSFINSTEPQKAKGNLPNLKDIFTGEQSDDNSEENINLDNELEFDNCKQTTNRINLFKANSIYDYLIIILTRICNLKFSNSLLCKLLIILQPLLNNTIEYIFNLSIKIKINNLLTKDNINRSIQLLKETLIEIDQQDDKLQTLTKLEKLRRQKSQETLITLQDYFNNFLPNYLSFLNLNNQTGYFLHSIFQYQLLNKQLLYLFFNLLIEDLFPEIINFDKKKYTSL